MNIPIRARDDAVPAIAVRRVSGDLVAQQRSGAARGVVGQVPAALPLEEASARGGGEPGVGQEVDEVDGDGGGVEVEEVDFGDVRGALGGGVVEDCSGEDVSWDVESGGEVGLRRSVRGEAELRRCRREVGLRRRRREVERWEEERERTRRVDVFGRLLREFIAPNDPFRQDGQQALRRETHDAVLDAVVSVPVVRRLRLLQDLLARLLQQLKHGRVSITGGGRGLVRLSRTLGRLEEILAPGLVHRRLRQRLGHDGGLAELDAVAEVDHGVAEADEEAREQVVGALVAREEVLVQHPGHALGLDFGCEVDQVVSVLRVVAEEFVEAGRGLQCVDDLLVGREGHSLRVDLLIIGGLHLVRGGSKGVESEDVVEQVILRSQVLVYSTDENKMT